ncbi:uncharacterized protein LOC124552289 [Schistocerca americana]|uniref:uncharacterized protein LOC124552289 n=1 Tax=Schistocerca americana TaxID=7009 RepID=UPI001F4FBAFC|nr:uncharacterized protein LOC124552289 [Schistocerca americana]
MPGEGNTQLKWQHVAGDCRILSDILAEKDNKSPWLLFKFLDALLRGYGQVLFCNNPLTGALLLAALAVADWTVCLWGLLAAATGLLVSVAAQQDMGAVRAGATTFNSLLVGLVSASALRGIYGTALEEDPRIAVIVVAGAAICALVASGMTRLLSHLGGVPSLALPFVLTQALIFFCVAHASLMAPASDNGGQVVADVTSPAAAITQVPTVQTHQPPRPVVPVHHTSTAWTAPLNASVPAQLLSSAIPTLPRDVEIIQVPDAVLRNRTPSESIGASSIRRRRLARSAMMEEELLLQDGSNGRESTTEAEQSDSSLGKAETIPVPAAEDVTLQSSLPVETIPTAESTYAMDVTNSLSTTEVFAEGTDVGGGILYGANFLLDELMQNDGPPQFASATEENESTTGNDGNGDPGASNNGESNNGSVGDITTIGTTKLGQLSEEHQSTVTEVMTTVVYTGKGVSQDQIYSQGVSSTVSSSVKEEGSSTANGNVALRSSAAPPPKDAHPAETMELSESRSAAASALEGPSRFQAPREPAMSDRQPVAGPVDTEAGAEVEVEVDVEPASGEVDWGRVFGSILLAPTQAFGLEHEVAGALMYLGVALSSPVTAAALAAGAIVGAFTALLVGAPLEGIYSAGWTFNAMLTHGALCGFLFVWSPLSQGVALAAAAFSVALFSAVEPAMSSVPMPVMSLPFNLTTMLFFSVASRRLWRPEELSSPEQHFRDYRAEMKKRRRDAERQRMMDEEPAKEKKAPLAEAEKLSDAEEV